MAARGRKNADEALALALAAGSTVEAAARHAQVSERTAYRRLEDPAFRRRIDAVRGQLVERTIGRLSALGTVASDALGKLVQSKDERVRLGAVRTALDFMFRGTELFELERRLGDLEERLGADAR